MAADLFQRELMIPESEQASLLGGAFLGLHILGEWPDLSMAPMLQTQQKMDVVRRDSSIHQHYQAYLAAYEQTRRLQP